MIKLTLAALLLTTVPGPAAVVHAEENLLKPFGEAFAAWHDGRPEDAAGSLKYVIFRSSDTVLTLAAIKELSVILAELGKNQEALAYLSKGEALAPEDPFLAFEKGWDYLSLENPVEARSSFEKAVTLTGEADLVNQARFGLAQAEAQLGGPSDAATSLQTVYQKYPYLLSPVAEVISAQYELLKKPQNAITFLKETLTYDPRNIQAEIDLARLYDQSGLTVPAWQTYYTLSELDPDDKFSAEKTAKLARSVAGKLDNLLYWNRMSWPAHNKPLNYADKNPIRVGLFSDANGEPAPLTEFNFIANTAFSIIDSRLGPVESGKALMQWNVRYNPLNKICELRDNMGSVAHSTRNSFRLVPKTAGGVMLIKNPEPVPQRGVNRGDREVGGELNVIIKENGVRLVNTVPLEEPVPSIVTALAKGSRLMEELKALAVVVRSKLVRLKSAKPHADRDYDLCDSPHCLAFPGLQTENESAVAAAELTREEVLSRDGAPMEGAFHTACGGFTADGVSDTGRAPGRMTPFNLYYLTLKAPSDDLLCLPEDKTTASDVAWTLMLEPKWIENRVNRRAKIGYIRSMAVLKRSPRGNVETLRIEGTAGSTVLEGFDAVSRTLSGGTLRSPLFTMRPVFYGKYPKYFLLRGIGTGDGRGYCVLGGHGMAKNLGSRYPEILKHYFPYYKTMKLPGR
ncbi:MAG: SpoIID/LytB domain-containing protein [Elusimicrobiales bacterium]|jgi:SpoIID/LytB domain protein